MLTNKGQEKWVAESHISSEYNFSSKNFEGYEWTILYLKLKLFKTLSEYLPLACFLYPIFWSFSIFALLDLNRPSSTLLVSLMHFLSIKLITYKKYIYNYIYNFSSSKATRKAFFGFKYQPVEKIDHSRIK
jgi:hypothetical protein